MIDQLGRLTTSEVSQETINRALLGDEEAAKECGEHDYAIPCQMCGSPRVTRGEYTCTCAECDHDAVVWVVAGEPQSVRRRAGLDAWNYRPDVRKAAREVYAPKWIACAEKMPPNGDRVLVYYNRQFTPDPKPTQIIITAIWFDGYWICNEAFARYSSEEASRFTHWAPLPQPPEAKDDN